MRHQDYVPGIAGRDVPDRLEGAGLQVLRV